MGIKFMSFKSTRFVSAVLLFMVVFCRLVEAHPGHGAAGGSRHWSHYLTSPYHLISTLLVCVAGWLAYRVVANRMAHAAAKRRRLGSAAFQISESGE